MAHLLWVTAWFVAIAVFACGLDLAAEHLPLSIGVTEATQKPLVWGAHLLMWADLVLLSVSLLETIGVHAVKAMGKVKKEASKWK